MTRRFDAPDGVQLIFQFLLFSSTLNKFPDFVQLESAAGFKPAGIMEDKAVSGWILKLMFDIVFSALKNYIECIITEDTD
jgi:hypothetical protein